MPVRACAATPGRSVLTIGRGLVTEFCGCRCHYGSAVLRIEYDESSASRAPSKSDGVYPRRPNEHLEEWETERTGMASDKIKTVTDGNFDDTIKEGLVLVDFWAPWCGPCRMLAPAVDALAEDFNGRATVAKMDVDENPNVPTRFAIRGIPTLLLFKGGEVAETVIGVRSKEDLAKMIERHL